MPKMRPLKNRKTIANQVYDDIRELMLTGEFNSDTLISANSLAKQLAVSRTPIREALLQLANEGFLESLCGRGFKIKNYTQREIIEYFEARRIIEVYVIGRMAKSITKKQLSVLKRQFQLMKKYAAKCDSTKFLEEDRNFHLSLIQLYENRYLESIFDRIRTLISILGQSILNHSSRVEETLAEHLMIIQALEKGNAKKAQQAAYQHLIKTENKITEKLKDKSKDDSLSTTPPIISTTNQLDVASPIAEFHRKL